MSGNGDGAIMDADRVDKVLALATEADKFLAQDAPGGKALLASLDDDTTVAAVYVYFVQLVTHGFGVDDAIDFAKSLLKMGYFLGARDERAGKLAE